jgi:hypothetical protein
MRPVRELPDQHSRALESGLLAHPEHRAQDHPERDRSRALVQRERLSDRPAPDVSLGDRADRVLPALDVSATVTISPKPGNRVRQTTP